MTTYDSPHNIESINMSRPHILIVDDEKDIREMIQYNLEKEQYQVTALSSGDEVISAVRQLQPDLLLLDLMLPEMDGFEICKILKSDPKTTHIPIIMVTAKGEESDIVTGLELGAEDYISKPFSPRVMTARIRKVLRRERQAETENQDTIEIHNIVIIPARFEVLVDGKPVDLTAGEFHILQFLVKRPGWVFTRSQIIDAVKGADYPVTDRSVDVQIVGLRKKLGTAGRFIDTVRGIGYRFKES